MADEGWSNGDFYTVLGVSSDANQAEIKKMYQKLVLKFHPDKFNPQTTELTPEDARERFYHIDKAWKTLSNPESKAKYDALLRDVKLTQEWPVNAEVDLSEMDFDEESNCYRFACRCSGSYTVTEENLEKGESIVCCSTCTLTIQVLFCIEEDNE